MNYHSYFQGSSLSQLLCRVFPIRIAIIPLFIFIIFVLFSLTDRGEYFELVEVRHLHQLQCSRSLLRVTFKHLFKHIDQAFIEWLSVQVVFVGSKI